MMDDSEKIFGTVLCEPPYSAYFRDLGRPSRLRVSLTNYGAQKFWAPNSLCTVNCSENAKALYFVAVEVEECS
jgi:hypothetical protein